MRRPVDRHLSKMVVAIACLAMAAQTAAAQSKGGGAFGMGYTDIGPTVGIGNLNGASASFGGRFEHAIKQLPDMGNGMLGIQVAAQYYSWDYAAGPYSWSVKNIPIGVTGNYHFHLDEPKIDPFVGLGLGYNIYSCSYGGPTISGSCSYSSGIYFIGRAGARYFFSPTMAAYGDVGAGGATLNLGVMFKLR
jgi:outer membrane protein W